MTHPSQYYTERTELKKRRKYAKLSIGADVLQQIICTDKIRQYPARHDNVDFRQIVTRTSNILPLSVVICKNHTMRKPRGNSVNVTSGTLLFGSNLTSIAW